MQYREREEEAQQSETMYRLSQQRLVCIFEHLIPFTMIWFGARVMHCIVATCYTTLNI